MNQRAHTSRVENVNEGSPIGTQGESRQRPGFYDLYPHPQRKSGEIKVIDRYEFVFLKFSKKSIYLIKKLYTFIFYQKD